MSSGSWTNWQGRSATTSSSTAAVTLQSGVQFDGLLAAFVQIAAASGFFSLWDGWQPNCQRSFIVNAAELASDRSDDA